jgi:uncharacterized protein YcaQ
LEWKQINAWRMTQHFLAQRAEQSQLLDVVSRLSGLQAQLMSATELQLWARVDGLEANSIHSALWKKRTLVKTWVWRGTLYLVTAHDFPLYIAGRCTITSFRRGSWYRYFGVAPDELEALLIGVRELLTDKGVTRDALADKLAEHTKIPKFAEKLRSGWGALLKPSASQGDVCFGTNDERNVTFVNPRRWLGDWDDIPSEEALPEIARRFLTVFAPATPDEFARWFGFAAADAKRIFKALAKQDEITEIDVEGWRGWILSATQAALENAKSAQNIRLLPNFDPYTLAVAKHYQYVMPAEQQARVYRAQGWISPVVLLDGRIIGVWEYETKRKQTTVTIDLFDPATKHVKSSIEAEAQRLGAFLGTTIQIVYR